MLNKKNKLINDIKKHVSDIFSEKTSHYSNLELNEYRKIVKNAQEILNEKFRRQIAENIKDEIQTFIEEKFYIQTNLYLRASRPFVKLDSENIDWHRESFMELIWSNLLIFGHLL